MTTVTCPDCGEKNIISENKPPHVDVRCQECGIRIKRGSQKLNRLM